MASQDNVVATKSERAAHAQYPVIQLIIRRAVSILFFVIGGALSMLEVGYGFMGMEGFLLFNLVLSSVLAILAIPFLAVAAWISPGARWRELGLTVLISAGAGFVLGAVLMYDYYYPDLGILPPSDGPTPPLSLAPLSGMINLIIICWFGWVLYGGRERIQRMREFADEWISGH